MQTKRTKASRHRGSSSHGWGHKKKHRGAGHRGGVGLAGTGARGDSQKAGLMANAKGILKKMAARKGTSISKLIAGNKYFGKAGFKSIHKKKQNVLSLSYIEANYDKMVANGMIEKDVFDSTVFGYDKVLGRGAFSRKIKIVCNEISDSAKARVEEAGGSVEVLKAKALEE